MKLLDLLIKSRTITKEEKTINKQGYSTTINKTVEVIEYHKIEDTQLKEILKKEIDKVC